MRDAIFMANDTNVQSLISNLYCNRKQNASVLKELIDQLGLFINNKHGRSTCSISQKFSVVDLALTILESCLLTL